MPDVIAGLQPAVDRSGDDGIRRSLELWREIMPAYTAEDALRALAERAAAQRRWDLFFERYPVIVMPVSYDLPYRVGFDIESRASVERLLLAQTPLTAVSVLGLPALSVPTGASGNTPVGVQIVAGRYREDLCFEIGRIIEADAGTFTPVAAPRLP
jgi:amidase